MRRYPSMLVARTRGSFGGGSCNLGFDRCFHRLTHCRHETGGRNARVDRLERFNAEQGTVSDRVSAITFQSEAAVQRILPVVDDIDGPHPEAMPTHSPAAIGPQARDSGVRIIAKDGERLEMMGLLKAKDHPAFIAGRNFLNR